MEFQARLNAIIKERYRKPLAKCTKSQVYHALLQLTQELSAQRPAPDTGRKLYYFSAEFLIGKLLSNNLLALGIFDQVSALLEKNGFTLAEIEEQEPEPSLGNGGLGRLAACFLDSLAALGLPGDGVGLNYHYGLFHQYLRNNKQEEQPDPWIEEQGWLIPTDVSFPVQFGNQTLNAVMWDIAVPGANTETANRLHLFDVEKPAAAPEDGIDFDKGDIAHHLTSFLYPDDSDEAGRLLRVYQQYFMVSAGAQLILKELDEKGISPWNLCEHVAIQINDTHPSMVLPELTRLLLERGLSMNDALHQVAHACAYTNHTILAEALEKWNVDIFKMTLPRIYQIVAEMDRRCRIELNKAFPGDKGKIDYMALIGDNQVRMANICAYTANSINGVSKLHSEIIKQSVFHDYYLYKPAAFKNVTNGIAYRRWLLGANPGLCKLLDDTIGTEYKHDASALSKLNAYAGDRTVLNELNRIKLANKTEFANYLSKSTGQVIDPNSIFDCQVKRMHEYKRQHLNALNIAAQYLYLKANPNADFIPKTYIFGAKAAPGYYMAKQMIRMICKLGDLINNDPAVNQKLRVVYLEEYCVSLSEHLMPASEVSEQISLAGTEASGTGNMKFMLNGAITLGTLDGANVEIAQAAGKENEIIFGMLTNEVENLKRVGYHPNSFITGDDIANEVLNFLERGWNGENFHEVTSNLFTSDPYMVMADFKDYRRAQADLQRLYADREGWAKMSLKNIANSGIFSADRAVLEYAHDIWYAPTVK